MNIRACSGTNAYEKYMFVQVYVQRGGLCGLHLACYVFFFFGGGGGGGLKQLKMV